MALTFFSLAFLALVLVYAAWRWRRSGRIEAERDALSRAVEAAQEREEIHGEVIRLPDAALDDELRKYRR